jgi:hypothetical protein
MLTYETNNSQRSVPRSPLALDSQHDAAVRCQVAAIKGRSKLLPSNGWKLERLGRYVRLGLCSPV